MSEIVRSLDLNGDWNFGKGKNDYLIANAAIVQNIATRLNSFLGDCFFDLAAGLDWFNLLGSKSSKPLELAVRSVILNTQNVVGLVDVSINIEETTRRIDMKYTVNTIYTVALQIFPVVGTSSFLLTEDGSILTTEDGESLVLG